MNIKKVEFICEDLNKPCIDIGNLDKISLVFEKGNEHPVLIMISGKVKIEDSTLEINCDEILKQISKIDFSKQYDENIMSEYNRNKWELIIDGKKYCGVFDNPYYVVLIKKIIKYNAVEVYANKKLAAYFRK